ncbi:MAG: hypothetical protein FD134_1931, partial [Gallionellaceae bacterium]
MRTARNILALFLTITFSIMAHEDLEREQHVEGSSDR